MLPKSPVSNDRDICLFRFLLMLLRRTISTRKQNIWRQVCCDEPQRCS